ncbi:MAG: hypothetical protein K0S25_1996 [Bacillus sp. (in: firmicutes)]|nr:hypothetical protein [Bacillus sp. (in: firmicutes)]
MNNKLETLKYFLECYFNMSANYDELESLINDFVSGEQRSYSLQLLKELQWVTANGHWDLLSKYVYKYGERNMNKQKLQWFADTLLKVLKISCSNA